MKTLTIHTDGGARGNPGPAAVGVVFDCDDFHQEYEEVIGETTNNVAEYTAVIRAIERIPDLITELQIQNIIFNLDSELVVKQIRGEYRVKEPTLQGLHQTIKTVLSTTTIPYTFTHVRREQNKLADKLVNHALDTASN